MHYRPYFALGFLASSFLLVGHAGQYFHKTVIGNWRYKRKVANFLKEELSMDEVLVLQRYSESGNKTQYFDPSNGAANNLVLNRILCIPSPRYNVLKGCPYTLTRAAVPFVLNRERFQKMVLDSPESKKRQQKPN